MELDGGHLDRPQDAGQLGDAQLVSVPPVTREVDRTVSSHGGAPCGTRFWCTFSPATPDGPEPTGERYCMNGLALEAPSSLFGGAPEAHAWPYVQEPLLERAGVLVDAEGHAHALDPPLGELAVAGSVLVVSASVAARTACSRWAIGGPDSCRARRRVAASAS